MTEMDKSEAIVITEYLINCIDQDEVVITRDELQIILEALQKETVQAATA